jgi:hypothetical protein
MLSKLFLGKLFLNFSSVDKFLANTKVGKKKRIHKMVAVNFFTACLLLKR